MAVLSTIWWLLELFVLYSLGWFLLSSFLFLTTKGESPALRAETAAVLGVFTTICHVLICAIKTGVCG